MMDQDACRRLKGEDPDENINSMRSCRFALKLYKALDGNPTTCNWEMFLSIASELRPWYNRSLTDIAILSNHNGSKAQKLLWDLGSSGMLVHELVYILDRLRLENLLMDIKADEPLVIVKDLERTRTIHEGFPLTLTVDGTAFPYPRYQWLKVVNRQWSALRAETSNIFTIEAARQSDSGLYCCKISNRNHIKSSSKAHVHIIPRPLDPVRHIDMSRTREAVEDTESIDITLKSIHSKPESNRPQFEARAKVALLIGNSDYMVDPLSGIPEADVRLMASTLENLDFKVVPFVNLSKSEIYATIQILISFINSIGTGVYVMFCYFGHGFEESRKCYLVPSDAVQDYGSVDCVCADDILEEIETKTNPALIVMALDMCRKGNPSPRRRQNEICFGMRNDDEQPRRGHTVVLYSTSKGMSAFQDRQHGLLAKSFNQRIQQNSDVTDVMKQVLSDMRIEMCRHNIQQIPQFTSTLNENRSFRDEISGGEEISNVFRKWRNVFEPPLPRNFFVPGTNFRMKVEFQLKTLNAMFIRITVDKTKEFDDIDISELDVSLHHTDQIRSDGGRREWNIHTFEIKDIQKLEEDLLIKLSIQNKRLRLHNVEIEMNLKRPLIASLDTSIWKNRL